jgi:hypothetical protein
MLRAYVAGILTAAMLGAASGAIEARRALQAEVAAYQAIARERSCVDTFYRVLLPAGARRLAVMDSIGQAMQEHIGP